MKNDKKYIDPSWDFRGSNTKEYTHCFHRYPAQMIPQIARRLISMYGKKGGLLFDPYCGSGTSLVEGLRQGMDVVGCDINPLAIVMSKAKTNKVSLKLLLDEINNFETFLLPFNIDKTVKKIKPTIPIITNIDFWFPQKSIEHLGILRTLLDRIENRKVKDFFTVAFSETVRESSYTRSGEFKLFRIPENKLSSFKADPFQIFLNKLYRNITGYKAFLSVRQDNACNIYQQDTTIKLPSKAESIQLVMTSPPYGDSRTTVAYGQYSTLPLEWLDFEAARKIDSLAMGGKRNGDHVEAESKTLKNSMSIIQSVDAGRAKDVLAFYSDYYKSIKHTAKAVIKGGYICYVVGNRTVKSHNIPTDDITVDLFENCGFVHEKTIIRDIPNKAMPSKNSPSNKPGVLLSTMTKEYIVVMKKK